MKLLLWNMSFAHCVFTLNLIWQYTKQEVGQNCKPYFSVGGGNTILNWIGLLHTLHGHIRVDQFTHIYSATYHFKPSKSYLKWLYFDACKVRGSFIECPSNYLPGGRATVCTFGIYEITQLFADVVVDGFACPYLLMLNDPSTPQGTFMVNIYMLTLLEINV